ncbi:MAG TPA: methyltransferase domain-containing protein, partial [Thermoanaerobaculia bacterium]|nr:methyltransferase domain-containing protein [Thermoanaerobaculia bacterium]
KPVRRAVDLGCATGELTRELHRLVEAGETLGIDNSSAMIEKSRPFAGNGVTIELGDIASFMPERPFDLVFSNAAIHWVPDHPALLARLTRAVAPGGQLAVQVPANHDHPAHRAAAEVAGEEPFRSALSGEVHPCHVLPPEAYAALLVQVGYAEPRVRLQVYVHRLPTRDAVVDWVRGTLLTHYQSRLSEVDFARFVERYRERLAEVLPDTAPFVFTFKRILFWGRRT